MTTFGRRVGVGIDIGSSRVRALQMERTKDRWRVVRYGSAPTPPGTLRDGVVNDPATIGAVIKDVLREAHIAASFAAIAVAGSAVFVRPVPFPKLNDQNLRKSVRYEATRFVPGSLEDSYLAYEVLGDLPDDQMNVLLVAAPRDIVESRIASCSAAGLDVEVVDVEVFAAYRSLLESNPAFDPKAGTIGILDIGASSTTVSVVHNGVFAMHRSIPHGGRVLTEALAQQFGLTPEDAEVGKAQLDVSELVGTTTPPSHPPLRIIANPLEDLVREIRRSVNYFQSQMADGDTDAERNVSRVLLTGGGARLKGLDLYLDHRLGLPVIETGLFDDARIAGGHAEDGRGVDLAVVAGLAMRALAA